MRYCDKPFTVALPALMRARGVTYRELSKRTGVHYGNITQYIRGERRVPSQERLEDFASALGVAPSFFLEYRLRELTDLLTDRPEALDRCYAALRRA